MDSHGLPLTCKNSQISNDSHSPRHERPQWNEDSNGGCWMMQKQVYTQSTGNNGYGQPETCHTSRPALPHMPSLVQVGSVTSAKDTQSRRPLVLLSSSTCRQTRDMQNQPQIQKVQSHSLSMSYTTTIFSAIREHLLNTSSTAFKNDQSGSMVKWARSCWKIWKSSWISSHLQPACRSTNDIEKLHKFKAVFNDNNLSALTMVVGHSFRLLLMYLSCE